jgi:hypothetical protein
MIELPSQPRHLSARELGFRAAYLPVICLCFATFRFLEPARISEWLPFHTSCGAITGLPCLFCGTTRAIHHLLNGDFAAAFYYNWLAFPVCGGVLWLTGLFAAELIARRKLLLFDYRLNLTPKRLAVSMALLIALWSLQVYLTISQHKRELLNPSGSLYALFVK